MKLTTDEKGRNFLYPFLLISSLFFLWGFSHSILDVLNKHFQDALHLSKSDSAWIQAVVYGGYGLCALPAGWVISRWGYRCGVLMGLMFFGVGALLFVPGSQLNSFPFFLMSLFIIGCGLTFLETSANPYTTVLGSAKDAERRINLSQSLNGLGWILGPIVGGWFLFTDDKTQADLATPYMLLGAVVLAIALLFSRVHLPELGAISLTKSPQQFSHTPWDLFRQRSFVLGWLALFFYVAAQTGINSFFINYAHETTAMTEQSAANYLGFGGMGLFLLGRVVGSWLMQYWRAERLLLLCAIGALIGVFVSIISPNQIGFYALFGVYLCESIMFPTIFALAIRNLGTQTKLAASLLIMSIVGGALAPWLMGTIADNSTMALGFFVPWCCFAVILGYSLWTVRNNKQ